MIGSIATPQPLRRVSAGLAGGAAGLTVGAGAVVVDGLAGLWTSSAILDLAKPSPPIIDVRILGPILGAYGGGAAALVAATGTGVVLGALAAGHPTHGIPAEIRRGLDDLGKATSSKEAAQAGWHAGSALGRPVGAVAGGIESFGVTWGLAATFTNTVGLAVAGGLAGAAVGALAGWYVGDVLGGAAGAASFAARHQLG